MGRTRFKSGSVLGSSKIRATESRLGAKGGDKIGDTLHKSTEPQFLPVTHKGAGAGPGRRENNGSAGEWARRSRLRGDSGAEGCGPGHTGEAGVHSSSGLGLPLPATAVALSEFYTTCRAPVST